MKKRYGWCVLAGVMLLAAGCSSQTAAPATTAAAESAGETTEAVEISAAEEPSDDVAESVAAAEESIAHAEESIAHAEESLKAREESLEALEESQEELADQEQEVSYTRLLGKPEDYKDKKVVFTGEITRSAPLGSDSVQIVLAVDGKTDQPLVGEYRKALADTELDTGDVITIHGVFTGVVRYGTSQGPSNMPTVSIDEITDIKISEEHARAQEAAETAGAAGTEVSGIATGIPAAVTGVPESTAGTPEAAAGTPEAAAGTPEAAAGTPGVVYETPGAVAETSEAAETQGAAGVGPGYSESTSEAN